MTNEQQESIRRLRADGEGYKRIGSQLGLSVNTVKSFCRRSADAVMDARTEQTNASRDSVTCCPRCQGEVKSAAGHRTKVFCSNACRVAYWRSRAASSVERVCVGCGRSLTGKDRHRKYCGHACYIAHRFRHEEGAANERTV